MTGVMHRLLYEYSVSYRGHLIIPYLHSRLAEKSIYSYKLLSALAHKGKFHKADNPAGLHSSRGSEIVAIAKEHLNQHSDIDDPESWEHCFKERYTYRDNLIIVYREGNRCFYDHYPPRELNNIAAPKIFLTESDCLNWVKQGLDRNYAS